MNETVLIVEDDSDIIEILSLYLCGSDYQVETAANGKLGLELLERKSPSVILVDLMMPEMNGFDFIKEARLVSNAPIIIISARSQPTDKMLGLDLGADGYITKPFDPIEVLAYIRAVLRRCNALSASGPSNISPDVRSCAWRHRIRQRVLDRSEEQQRGFLYGLGIEDIQQTVLLARPRVHEGAIV